jgi:hypothetical protein
MSGACCNQFLIQALDEHKLTLPQPAGPMTSWAYLPISLISHSVVDSVSDELYSHVVQVLFVCVMFAANFAISMAVAGSLSCDCDKHQDIAARIL